MIQAGMALVISPMSIQPERRVITIGASSDNLVVERAKPRAIPGIEDIAAFVMAFFLSRSS
jgi:hypothetical protein